MWFELRISYSAIDGERDWFSWPEIFLGLCVYVGRVDTNTSGSQLTVYSCRHCGSVILDERRRQCCNGDMESIDVDAVKEPEQRVLLRHVFGISQTGLDICTYVMEHGEATPAEIARALDINRSTATRQLNQLRDLGVMECRKESLTGGGEVQTFSPVSMAEIRQRHRESLLSWVTDAIDLINELDRRKLEAAAARERTESSLEAPADE